MSRATGALLVIVGVWLVVASLAGRLAERILSLVPGQFGAAGRGEGGPFIGTPDMPPSGGGGGGGGAW